jgi:TRAP-type transport system small permease protein
MSKTNTWVERYVFPPIRAIHKFGYYILFLLMFLTVGDIIGRYLAGKVPGFQPIPGTFELTEFSLAVIVFASIGYTELRKEHIRIDVLTARFPKKVQAWLDVVIYLMMIIMFSLVAWQSILYAGRLINGHDVSGVLSIPVYPFLIVVAIGSIIYTLALVVSLIQSFAKAVQHGS